MSVCFVRWTHYCTVCSAHICVTDECRRDRERISGDIRGNLSAIYTVWNLIAYQMKLANIIMILRSFSYIFLLSFDIVNFFPPNVQMLSSISRFPSKVIKMKLVLDMAKVIASFSLPKIHIAIIVLCLNFHHLPGNDAHLYACSVSDFDRTYDYMASLPHRLVFMLTNMCSNAVWMVITCRSTRICA